MRPPRMIQGRSGFGVGLSLSLSLSLSLALCGAAQAASQPDLDVQVLPPAATPDVYQSARYDVRVRNIGNKNAASVILTIQLPATGTSPQVYIMGNLGARDSRCALAGADGTAAGTRLVCNLGTINRNGGSTTPFFEIALPEKTGDLLINASATTTTLPETNPNNNSHTLVAGLNYKSVSMAPFPRASVIRHCTGTTLTAFFECTKFPSSITSHPTTFDVGGQLSIPGQPDYFGSWSQTGGPATLQFKYCLTSDPTCASPVAEFSGRGTSNTTTQCFEGLTHFPNTTYVSPYEVCLQ